MWFSALIFSWYPLPKWFFFLSYHGNGKFPATLFVPYYLARGKFLQKELFEISKILKSFPDFQKFWRIWKVPKIFQGICKNPINICNFQRIIVRFFWQCLNRPLGEKLALLDMFREFNFTTLGSGVKSFRLIIAQSSVPWCSLHVGNRRSRKNWSGSCCENVFSWKLWYFIRYAEYLW